MALADDFDAEALGDAPADEPEFYFDPDTFYDGLAE